MGKEGSKTMDFLQKRKGGMTRYLPKSGQLQRKRGGQAYTARGRMNVVVGKELVNS